MSSQYNDLEKLADLKNKGIITEEEFIKKKKEILEGSDQAAGPSNASTVKPGVKDFSGTPHSALNQRSGTSEKYTDYTQVPWFRKNWFAILCFFIFAPALFFILITGDVYYSKSGQLKTYGKVAKIFLIIWAIFATLVFIGASMEESSNVSESPSIKTEESSGDSQSAAVEKESSNGQSSEPSSGISITARELFAAYENNEIAADQKYKGQVIKITGSVQSIDSDLNDEPDILLNVGDPLGVSGVHAGTKKSMISKVASLKRGQTLTLICVGAGEVAGMPMVEDCEISGVEP